ncbi:MAG: muconate cycloisomerase family protein [Henriciella sp.]|nr:muconate cycloisomerase family protein [Henriciella sp.]
MSKLTIKSVETIIVDLPMRRLQRFSATDAKSQSVVLVRILTGDGIEGIGEACTPSGPWWGGESVESIKLMIDSYIAPFIVGADPFSISDLMATVDRAVFGNAFAKAGIEMALLDIQGKSVGLPLHDLLGGAVRRSLPCSWPLATGDADKEIEEAEMMLEAGRHNIFKMKMGALPPEEDVRRACRVAEGLSAKASVRVDPNEEWDETTAKWAAPRLADAGVVLIEQPFPRWNLDACARLTKRSNIAIMIDEGACTPHDMIKIVEKRAADLVSLKVMKSAGILNSKRIADIATAGGIELYMGTFLECSIGTAANMQLAVTLPHLPYGGELSGPGLVADDIAEEPARYEDFELQLAPGEGIGVRIDEDKLNHFRRDRTDKIHSIKTVA